MFEVKGNYGTAKVFSELRDEKAVSKIQVVNGSAFC